MKISFKDVAPSYIHVGVHGYEIKIIDGNIPTNEMTGRGIPSGDKIATRNYLKGLKKIFARAKENHVCDDVLGNYKSIQDKYYAILKSMSDKDIEQIGSGKQISLTFYVDGSVSHSIIK